MDGGRAAAEQTDVGGHETVPNQVPTVVRGAVERLRRQHGRPIAPVRHIGSSMYMLVVHVVQLGALIELYNDVLVQLGALH